MMTGPVHSRFSVHPPANTPVHPRKIRPKSFIKTILPVTHMGSVACAQNVAISMKTRIRGGGGRGTPWYGPGACLTEQTGSIPDTVQSYRRHVEGRHALESEQCDGREGAVCAGV